MHTMQLGLRGGCDELPEPTAPSVPSWVPSSSAITAVDQKALCSGDFGDRRERLKSPMKRRRRPERLQRLHVYVARTGVAALSASASQLSRQVENIGYSLADVEDDDSKLAATSPAVVAARIRATTADALTWLGASASAAAREFQPPPRAWRAAVEGDDTEEQDAPLALFWAINVAIVCGITGLVMFAMAFSTAAIALPGPLAEEVVSFRTEPLEDAVDSLRGNPGQGAPLRFKNIVVVCFAFAAGSALAQNHPLRSALLCGV